MKATVRGVRGLMEAGPARVPGDVETAIKAAIANPNRAEATLILASIANRATAALHQVARTEASARKGTPDWGKWAALSNVSRDAVLRTAASRQTATQLAQAERAASTPAQPEPETPADVRAEPTTDDD